MYFKEKVKPFKSVMSNIVKNSIEIVEVKKQLPQANTAMRVRWTKITQIL